jgi:hypothetical protein
MIYILMENSTEINKHKKFNNCKQIVEFFLLRLIMNLIINVLTKNVGIFVSIDTKINKRSKRFI